MLFGKFNLPLLPLPSCVDSKLSIEFVATISRKIPLQASLGLTLIAKVYVIKKSTVCTQCTSK